MTRTSYRTCRRILSLGIYAAVILALPDVLSAQYLINNTLPPIPERSGSLSVDLIYPEDDHQRPRVSRNFIFGSIGTGTGSLTINGTDVEIAPNGAFLAWLPVPNDGRYELIGTDSSGTVHDTLVYEYAADEVYEATPQVRDLHEQPILGEVTTGSDTLATGSNIGYGAPTKWADREWFFPKGVRFPVYEVDGDFVRTKLDGEDVWAERQYVTISTNEPIPSEISLGIEVIEQDRWVEVVIPAERAPFRIDLQSDELELRFCNALAYELEQRIEQGKPGRHSVTNIPNSLIRGYTWSAEGSGHCVDLAIELRRKFWGVKGWYDGGGGLHLLVRRPPAVDPDDPLAALTIVIDAGHPPRGATGPTGLTEEDANLVVARAIERKLLERGAAVVMTRRDGGPILTDTNASMELSARVAHAVANDGDLLISVHNNGFSDGVNPWEKNGTETYYYHNFASGLAKSILDELIKVTGVPSLGYKQRSLALARPTWMPSVLTESLYMMHPQQEAALRNPEFVERLADAHVRGIEKWVAAYR